MAGLITDKITEVTNGQNPVSTTVTAPRVAGGTTLSTANLAGWPTNTAVHFATYKIDGAGQKIAGTQIDWKGIVSGTNINSLTRMAGAADNGSGVGDVVQMMPTGSWGQDLAEGLQQSLDPDGGLKNGAVDSAAVLGNNVVTTAKILDANVTTAKLADDAVTPAKRSGGFKMGTIAGATLGTTGNKSITGLGFRPKYIRFSIVPPDSSTTMSFGWGSYDGTTQFAVSGSFFNTSKARLKKTDACINQTSELGASLLNASGVSLDSDGFTINVTIASSTYDVVYEAQA